MRALLLLVFLLTPLAGCDRLGIPDPAKDAAARDEEGKAIGGACRQSGRALEDCFTLNPGANKAAVFNGWKDMNDYMTQNKIETVKPELTPTLLNAKHAEATPAAGSEPKAEDEQSGAEDDATDKRAAARAAARKRRQEARQQSEPH
ncbi:hypothetical protein VVD49_00475 [Uliginosibacterium sp. H3]|uniref:Uncharacterized protein n=1 Tax=Uliginosibacterium silvisoli TaxID=3114758 RepID=A0ABU6JYX9_9RHOO|nr:hypothetical protein [Uliginosibacterium sp. H3]